MFEVGFLILLIYLLHNFYNMSSLKCTHLLIPHGDRYSYGGNT